MSEKRVFSSFGRINFSQSNTVLFSFCCQRNESESPSIEKEMEIFCTTECSLCKTLTKINIRSYKYELHNKKIVLVFYTALVSRERKKPLSGLPREKPRAFYRFTLILDAT